MPDFDTFWNGDGIVEFPVTVGREFVRYSTFREDPLLNPLGTPTGLIEIYSTNIERMGYDDCPPHPTWMEPAERLGGPNAKYPLHVATSHPKGRLHSQLAATTVRQSYEVNGREPCLINPADAQAGGNCRRRYRARLQRSRPDPGGRQGDGRNPARRHPGQRGRLVRSARARCSRHALQVWRREQPDARYRDVEAGAGEYRPYRGGRGGEVPGRSAAGNGVRLARSGPVTVEMPGVRRTPSAVPGIFVRPNVRPPPAAQAARTARRNFSTSVFSSSP